MARELDDVLKRMLCLKEGSCNILKNRESTQLEFKQSVNLGNLAKYAKTMASFANAEGGFLVFGIRDSPREIVGVNFSKFDSIDPVRITSFLNTHFSPEIIWDMGLIELNEIKVGYFYSYASVRKPVMALTNSGGDIAEGEIYYRYRGQTAAIKYPELRSIIDDRLDEERRAWLHHFKAISKVGPSNIAILDTIQGKIFGAGAPFLIDEKLLRQIKFIREGHFRESSGAPALKLIGELKTLGDISIEKVVHRGIHFEDLITAFLADRQIDQTEAKSYLIEACHQLSTYSPIFYFVKQAGISIEEAVALLESKRKGLKSTRNVLVARLKGDRTITPSGSIDGINPEIKITNLLDLEAALATAPNQKAERGILASVFLTAPHLLANHYSHFPIDRLLEAITHLEKAQIEKASITIRELLLTIFSNEFDKLNSTGQSVFRKSIAIMDQELNR
jgi:hypothetical protein